MKRIVTFALFASACSSYPSWVPISTAIGFANPDPRVMAAHLTNALCAVARYFSGRLPAIRRPLQRHMITGKQHALSAGRDDQPVPVNMPERNRWITLEWFYAGRDRNCTKNRFTGE